MRKLFLLSVALCVFALSQAQSKSTHSSSYRSALGVKFWDGAGVSFKHFFQGNNAGEFIGFFWHRGFRFFRKNTIKHSIFCNKKKPWSDGDLRSGITTGLFLATELAKG